jgi:hypothetical protein
MQLAVVNLALDTLACIVPPARRFQIVVSFGGGETGGEVAAFGGGEAERAFGGGEAEIGAGAAFGGGEAELNR